MLECFILGSVATPYTEPPQCDREVSPADCSLPSPVSPHRELLTLTHLVDGEDIVTQFAMQNLQPDENEKLQQSFCMAIAQDDFPTKEIVLATSTEGTEAVSASKTSPSTLPYHSRCKRLTRQRVVQLQSSKSHVKDINALVEDMIFSESQCVLRPPSLCNSPISLPPSRGRDADVKAVEKASGPRTNEAFFMEMTEDEGFAETEDDLDDVWGIENEMSLMRACTPSGIQKFNGLRWRRSFEVGGFPSSPGTPRKRIRSMPRMRRRSSKTVSEELGINVSGFNTRAKINELKQASVRYALAMYE